MKLTTQEIEIGGRKIVLEHGRFAQQANSAIVVRCGDTMVLVTVVASTNDTNLDYFPLTVEYVERLYAGGRIKGSRWVKREGRPLDEHILSARLIDRSVRPLFPKSFKKEVQVVVTVLSVDLENDPSVLAMVGASAALSASSIPWSGPVGSLRVGLAGDTPVANPLEPELESSDLDLIVTADQKSIFMVEAAAAQVPEEKILAALEFGQTEAGKIIAGIAEFAKKVGVKKQAYEQYNNKEVIDLIKKKYTADIERFIAQSAGTEGRADLAELKDAAAAELGDQKAALVGEAIEEVKRDIVRQHTLAGTRLDGRKPDQIREIFCAVGVLPRTHGSAVFARGQTQVLSATTLGAPSLEQTIESATGEEAKRYIHYYSMPPYATGETGRMGSPSRREIGHGALAERALLPIIPPEDAFPYTIQVVSEVMSSNGSTSMAAVCASTMSLMDAGVPVVSPVAGIAMGAVLAGSKAVILSDIAGIEDTDGDMDLKVAGTSQGVTAIQLDVKTSDLTIEILHRALTQAKEGRLFILDKMLAAIAQPRAAISTYAPKISVVKIPPGKIGEVIGPGGRVIRKIMAETGTQVDVEDDGSVTVSALTQEAVDQARDRIESLVKEVVPGEIYEGEVVRIQPFGAFVQILPGKDGLVHVSDMGEGFVKSPEDVVKIADKVRVRVKEIDNLGRINLSMRLDPSQDRDRARVRDGGERPFAGPRREGPRGERRFTRPMGERRFGRGRREGGRDERFVERGGRERRERGEAGGPHFPASRLVPSKRRF